MIILYVFDPGVELKQIIEDDENVKAITVPYEQRDNLEIVRLFLKEVTDAKSPFGIVYHKEQSNPRFLMTLASYITLYSHSTPMLIEITGGWSNDTKSFLYQVGRTDTLTRK